MKIMKINNNFIKLRLKEKKVFTFVCILVWMELINREMQDIFKMQLTNKMPYFIKNMKLRLEDLWDFLTNPANYTALLFLRTKTFYIFEL